LILKNEQSETLCKKNVQVATTWGVLSKFFWRV